METAKWRGDLDARTRSPNKRRRGEYPAPSAKQALVTVSFATALLRQLRRKSTHLVGTVAIV